MLPIHSDPAEGFVFSMDVRLMKDKYEAEAHELRETIDRLRNQNEQLRNEVQELNQQLNACGEQAA